VTRPERRESRMTKQSTHAAQRGSLVGLVLLFKRPCGLWCGVVTLGARFVVVRLFRKRKIEEPVVRVAVNGIAR
jgi:hypothetical protein